MGSREPAGQSATGGLSAVSKPVVGLCWGPGTFSVVSLVSCLLSLAASVFGDLTSPYFPPSFLTLGILHVSSREKLTCCDALK
jgi:hypothetical protein